MIPWKALWLGVGAVVAMAVAALHLWLRAGGIPLAWLWADAGAVALLALFTLSAPAIIDHARMFASAPEWQRRRVWIASAIGAAAFCGWTIGAVHLAHDTLSQTLAAVSLTVLVAAAYAAARGAEWLIERVAPAKARAALTSTNAALAPTQHLRGSNAVMTEALRRAGVPWMTVVSNRKLANGAGRVFRLRSASRETIARMTAASKAAVKAGTRAAPVSSDITPDTAQNIAAALDELTPPDREVESDHVRLVKLPGATAWELTVLNWDVMKEVVPYVDPVDSARRPLMTSIGEPAWLGHTLEALISKLDLKQHGRLIGGTTWGKSAVLHILLAHLTRCTDAIVWICGRQKLYDLVAGWLEPYLDTGETPPIDWVANGQHDTLRMFAAAMNVARWRQAQPLTTRNWRSIVVICDEASYVLTDSVTTIEYDSQQQGGSAMASAILRGAASADVFLKLASQRSTGDHTGSHGGDISANVTYSIGLRSNDFADLGRVTGNYHLQQPKHKGEGWVFADGDPVNTKFGYIQSADPSKPILVDTKLTDVAWSRRHLDRPGLAEHEGLAAAGPAYADRHVQVTEDYLAYLRAINPVPATEDGTPAAGAPPARTVQAPAHMSGAAKDAYEAALEALAAVAMPSGSSAVTSTRTPRPRLIASILTAADTDGLTITEVTEQLHQRGDTSADVATVGATLSREAKAGRIIRVAEGRYAHPTAQRTLAPNAA